jgi:hypothetical protein
MYAKTLKIDLKWEKEYLSFGKFACCMLTWMKRRLKITIGLHNDKYAWTNTSGSRQQSSLSILNSLCFKYHKIPCEVSQLILTFCKGIPLGELGATSIENEYGNANFSLVITH